jgi:hypothetical protein
MGRSHRKKHCPPVCPKKCKPKIKIVSLTPGLVDVNCTTTSFTISFDISGSTCNVPIGSTIAIQYTREFDPKTAVLIGTTITDSSGLFRLTVPSLVVQTPTLGNLRVFAQFISGNAVVAVDCAKIQVKCSTPPLIPTFGPYPCTCCTRKSCFKC